MAERAAFAPELPLFSERLTELLEAYLKGEAPNAGRFCGYCYSPIDAGRRECPNCGRSVDDHAPVERVPDGVIAMFRRKRRRESLVVNSFAYIGLALSVVIFIVVFYFIFMSGGNLWLYAFNIALLFVLARVLAGLIGGFVGDDLGFRYARRKLADEWREYEAGRESHR
jgi:hypothetical protein